MKTVRETKDSYHFTKGAFYLMGVLTYLPNNFFTTSTDFWMYKFRPPHPPPPPGHRPNGSRMFTMGSDYNVPEDRNTYQAHITATLAYTNIVSTALSLLFLIALRHKLPSATSRIKGSIMSTFVIFVVATLFTMMLPDTKHDIFFGVIIVVCILMNFSAALTTISLYEIVTKFPIFYYVAVTSGHVTCSILASLIQIITLSPNLEAGIKGAIYFSSGSLLIFAGFITFWFIERNSKYFIYRIGQSEMANEPAQTSWVEFKRMQVALKKLKCIYATSVIVGGTTALVSPGFIALISSVDKNTDKAGIWTDVYFVPVITFLGRQICSLIGREAAKIVKLPKNWSYVILASVLRLSLVVLLLFCNAQPRERLPVVFGDDAYIIIIFTFGFSEGLLLNLSFIAIPSIANEDEVEIAVLLVPLIETITVLFCGTLNLGFISLI